MRGVTAGSPVFGVGLKVARRAARGAVSRGHPTSAWKTSRVCCVPRVPELLPRHRSCAMPAGPVAEPEGPLSAPSGGPEAGHGAGGPGGRQREEHPPVPAPQADCPQPLGGCLGCCGHGRSPRGRSSAQAAHPCPGAPGGRHPVLFSGWRWEGRET